MESEYPWLHWMLGREDAEKALMSYGAREGQFLVRVKDASQGVYALSVVTRGRPTHHLITRQGTGWFINQVLVKDNCSLEDVVNCLRLPNNHMSVTLNKPITTQALASGQEDEQYMLLWETQTDDLYMDHGSLNSLSRNEAPHQATAHLSRSSSFAGSRPGSFSGGMPGSDDDYSRNANIARRARPGSAKRPFPKLSAAVIGDCDDKLTSEQEEAGYLAVPEQYRSASREEQAATDPGKYVSVDGPTEKQYDNSRQERGGQPGPGYLSIPEANQEEEPEQLPEGYLTMPESTDSQQKRNNPLYRQAQLGQKGEGGYDQPLSEEPAYNDPKGPDDVPPPNADQPDSSPKADDKKRKDEERTSRRRTGSFSSFFRRKRKDSVPDAGPTADMVFQGPAKLFSTVVIGLPSGPAATLEAIDKASIASLPVQDIRLLVSHSGFTLQVEKTKDILHQHSASDISYASAETFRDQDALVVVMNRKEDQTGHKALVLGGRPSSELIGYFSDLLQHADVPADRIGEPLCALLTRISFAGKSMDEGDEDALPPPPVVGAPPTRQARVLKP